MTRREVLATEWVGMLRNERPAGATGRPQSARSEAPHFAAQSQARHLSVPERRTVAGRHVRSEADARPSITASRCRRRISRPSARPATCCDRRSSSSKYGQSGIEVSEIFSEARRVHRRHLRDPLDAHRPAESRAVAVHAELRRHSSRAVRRWARGSPTGSGTENQNLPGFVVLCPGLPVVGPQLWSSQFLPASLSGHLHSRTTRRIRRS